MIARCARCQGTFTTDRFGRQTCPHCGSELYLADPNAPPPAAGQAEGGAPPPGAQPPPAPQPPSPPSAASPEPPPYAGRPGAYPPAGPAGPEASSPFAERRQRGWLASFFETWKLVATRPHEFFRRVRIDQTGAAILFGIVAAVAGNVFNGLYGWLTRQQVLVAMQDVFSRMPEEQAKLIRMFLGSGFELGQVLLSPIFAVIGIYVAAGILHLLLLLFRGARRGFDATLTVVAYAMGLNLLLAVPACGSLVALVWGVVVLIIGLGEAHRCGSGRSAAAVLAPLALACLCWCGVVGLSLPALMKSVEGAAKQGSQTTNL